MAEETPADRAQRLLEGTTRGSWVASQVDGEWGVYVEAPDGSCVAVLAEDVTEADARLLAAGPDIVHALTASCEAHEVTRGELHETKIRLGAERYEVERLGSVVEHRARQTDEARAEASRLRALLDVPFPTLEEAEEELRAAGQDPAAVGRRLRERFADHIIDGAGQTAAERARDLVSHMRAGDLTSLAHELGNILVPLGAAVARLPEDEHRERAERCMARLWALSDAVKASLAQDRAGQPLQPPHPLEPDPESIHPRQDVPDRRGADGVDPE